MAQSALVGYIAPGSPLPPLPLRLTRAGLVLTVSQRDPDNGLDLVTACQVGLYVQADISS